MNEELRELLLQVLAAHLRLNRLVEQYGPDYPDLADRLAEFAVMAIPVAGELEDILGGWFEPGADNFEDIELLDEGGESVWEDAQYEPFMF